MVLVDELRATVQRLDARVQALEHPAPRMPDAAWLVTIAEATQGRVFSVAELRAHRRVDAALRRALAGMSNQQIGKRLRRLHQRPVAPFRVDHLGRDQAGAIWQVRVDDSHADAGAVGNDGS
jgi:hypothetical protein